MKTFSIQSFLLAIIILAVQTTAAQELNKKLSKYTKELSTELNEVAAERQTTLKEVGDYILAEIDKGEKARVMFICTHNSRRSIMAQLWLQTAADYYGVDAIATFSGGTEATEFNANAIAAMKRAGFSIVKTIQVDKAFYTIYNGANQMMVYSKKYSDPRNVQSEFMAVMVCSDADKSCPIVDGAEARVALPFNDPRYFDDTPSQDEKYDETAREIAKEMFFLMDYVKNTLILKAEAQK